MNELSSEPLKICISKQPVSVVLMPVDKLTHGGSAVARSAIGDDSRRMIRIDLNDAVNTMPLLGITSPTKRCGKTTLLALLQKLVRRPISGVALTQATVYRAIEKWHPTLLMDEADGILKNSRGDDNVELRTVINSGHTREFAYVPRCEGENHDVRNFSTWGPKVLALIGRMPDSMADRSVHIQMVRKTKDDKTLKLRETPPNVFSELKSRIVRFVQDNAEAIGSKAPSFPVGLNDRAEDCWEPLFAIAEVAGNGWPSLAHGAALALSDDGDNDADTFSIAVLRSVERVFVDDKENRKDGFVSTVDICERLNGDEEAPWQRNKDKMTPEFLARILRPYRIKSERRTLEEKKVRGLSWEKLQPIFSRWL